MMLTKKEYSTESGILNSWEVHGGIDSELLGCHNLPRDAPSHSILRQGIDRILRQGPENWSPTPIGREEENCDTDWPYRSQRPTLRGLEGNVPNEVQSPEQDKEEDSLRATYSIQGLVRAKVCLDLVAAQLPSLTPSVSNRGELDLEGKLIPPTSVCAKPILGLRNTRHPRGRK